MELTSSVQKLGSIFGTELPQKWARKIFRDDITNFFATRARQNTTTPLYTVKFVILEHQLLTAVAVRSDREEILSDHMEVSSLSPANHHGAAVLKVRINTDYVCFANCHLHRAETVAEGVRNGNDLEYLLRSIVFADGSTVDEQVNLFVLGCLNFGVHAFSYCPLHDI
jgi:hypothetical protein